MTDMKDLKYLKYIERKGNTAILEAEDDKKLYAIKVIGEASADQYALAYFEFNPKKWSLQVLLNVMTAQHEQYTLALDGSPTTAIENMFGRLTKQPEVRYYGDLSELPLMKA